MISKTELRKDAVKELEKYGIEGPCLYLIDIIPLIEMIWADGKAQDNEIEVLNKYLDDHLKRINKLAGIEVISKQNAQQFAEQFITSRPPAELLKTLRTIYFKILESTENEAFKAEVKKSLLAACIDIGSSSVINYPYAPGERFNQDEKKCFFEIMMQS